MNRYTVRPILIGDPALANLRISGTFRTARPQDFATGLTSYFPIIAEETPNGLRLRATDRCAPSRKLPEIAPTSRCS